MKRKLIVLGVVLALQCSWILATAFVQERALANGATVLLDTRPVDPRDLLRGDYVILEYAINSIPVSKFAPPRTNAPASGTPVWVLLEQRGQFYEIATAFTEPLPPDDAAGPVLQGTATYSWRAGTNAARVEYGLERYYVAEGTGNPRGKLTVEVAVPKSGRGVIRQVYVDGTPYREAMKKLR